MADTTIDLLKNSSYVGKMDELIAAVKSGGGTASDVEWDNVKNKPTTIGGYGIIDAKIDNGTITLGNQTITPLTSAPVTSVNSKTGTVVIGKTDVGLGNVDNVKQYSISNPPPYPVTSVNGQTGDVTIEAGAPGKSAYDYAVDAGYTGTEAEFSARMAAEIPTVDGTLTKSGQAADAKATGDAIRSLSEEIENISSGTSTASIEPSEDDIPKVFITGDEFSNMTAAKNEVNMMLEYISKSYRFQAAIKIKLQGSSSLSYDKKNFTIKMYADDAYESKLKKSFKDWNHSSNKYVLKANYIDHSHARNIVSARIWDEVVASRSDYDSLPVEMRNSPRNGAVDGFPIKLYVNGTYQGIYTWNIGKDDWMWNMDENNANHVLLCGETNTNGTYAENACNFRALWSGSDGASWSIEVGTNSDELKTSLNNLIQFVMDNDGDDFRNGIENYLDVQSAIDYYLFMYVQCGLDGLAKNMLLATYDMKKWICGAYDMDSTWGLYWTGGSFVSAEYRCPEDYMEKFSLLWERIEANYVDELKARYAELRSGVFSYANLTTHFERFMDVIGLDLYAEDLKIYTGIPSGEKNNIQQIRNFIRDRLAYVDSEISAMVNPVPCTGITLSASSLSFTEFEPQTIVATVTPDGTTDTIYWSSNNESVATVEDGVVTPVANGYCTIKAVCGNYSAECSVVVDGQIACTGISLDMETMSFANTDTKTITATVTPDNTTDVLIWESDNTNIATVENGVVTPVSNGSAIITATCGEYSAVCAVTVNIRETATLLSASSADTNNGNNGIITVSNGNHVRVDYENLIMNRLLNISNITKGTIVNCQERIFKLSSGDVIVTTMTIAEESTFSGGSSIFVRKANASAGFDILPTSVIATDNVRTYTYTVTEDCDIGCIGLYVSNPNGAMLYEFDLSMTVNGEEYIIPNP